MKQYHDLLKWVLENGEKKGDRTGVGTISCFAPPPMRFDLSQGFPAITTKKLAWKALVSELLWFLEGSSDERRLAEILYGRPREELEGKKTIWTANVTADYWKDKKQHPGDLGKMYGVQWRRLTSTHLQEKRLYQDDVSTVGIFLQHLILEGKKLVQEGEMPLYDVWVDMLKRCYEPSYPSYQEDAFVERSWLNFSNFAKDVKTIPGWILQKTFLGYTLDNTFMASNRFSKVDCIWASPEEMKANKTLMESFPISCETPIPRVRIHDQIAQVIAQIKQDPNSRRIIVDAYNVGDLDDMCLHPCHPWMLFNVQNGKLSLMVTIRSNDLFLGNPFNVASYAILLHMIAQVCGLPAGELIISIGDAHIYTNHLEAVQKQLAREPYPLPKLWLNPNIHNINDFTMQDVKLEGYQYHDAIPGEMAV